MFIALVFLLGGCANEKDLKLNGQIKTFEPYGWANHQHIKNDSIIYQVNVGNVVWDIIACETIVVPVWLTGWELYEPVRVKTQYEKKDF